MELNQMGDWLMNDENTDDELDDLVRKLTKKTYTQEYMMRNR